MSSLQISWEILEEGVEKVKQQVLDMEGLAEVDGAAGAAPYISKYLLMQSDYEHENI